MDGQPLLALIFLSFFHFSLSLSSLLFSQLSFGFKREKRAALLVFEALPSPGSERLLLEKCSERAGLQRAKFRIRLLWILLKNRPNSV